MGAKNEGLQQLKCKSELVRREISRKFLSNSELMDQSSSLLLCSGVRYTTPLLNLLLAASKAPQIDSQHLRLGLSWMWTNFRWDLISWCFSSQVHFKSGGETSGQWPRPTWCLSTDRLVSWVWASSRAKKYPWPKHLYAMTFQISRLPICKDNPRRT